MWGENKTEQEKTSFDWKLCVGGKKTRAAINLLYMLQNKGLYS